MKWSNLDLVHYESRVLSKVGRWANFDELEESLTLNELFHLYSEVVDAEIRDFKAQAKAFGADVELNFGPPETDNQPVGNAFEGIMDRINSKRQEDLSEEDKERQEFSKMKLGYNKL